MKTLILFTVIAALLALASDVSGKKNKWLEKLRFVKSKNGKVDEGTTSKHRHHGHHKQHDGRRRIPQRHLNFKKTDALPYSSPYARPYDWSMYSDGPYGWGPSRKRREMNSFNKFKRSLYPQNYAPQYPTQQQPAPSQPAQQAAYAQPAQQAAYAQPAEQPYSYQAAASRNTLAQANTGYRPQPSNQILQKEAPEVQKPQERTWVDKLGVTWTTRKVNDYKWGEREPGIMMDQYAGGPFGFNDIKRNKIAQGKLQQWHRRSSIPKPSSNIRPRSWIDKHGVKWTMDHVNDYKWGEREPGVTMDEYSGGPFGWSDVKRNKISVPSSMARPRNMYMDKP